MSDDDEFEYMWSNPHLTTYEYSQMLDKEQLENIQEIKINFVTTILHQLIKNSRLQLLLRFIILNLQPLLDNIYYKYINILYNTPLNILSKWLIIGHNCNINQQFQILEYLLYLYI